MTRAHSHRTSRSPSSWASARTPAAARSSGGAAVNTVGGYATFPNPSIDAAGLGYTLVATSTSGGVTAGPSDPFNVMNLGKICTSGPCSGSTNGEVTGSIYTVDAVAGANGDRLDIGISLEELDCAGYDEQTDVVTFNVFSISGPASTRLKTLSMQFRPDPKAPKNTWRVCYSSPELGFVDRDGDTVAGRRTRPPARLHQRHRRAVHGLGVQGRQGHQDHPPRTSRRSSLEGLTRDRVGHRSTCDACPDAAVAPRSAHQGSDRPVADSSG